MSPDCLGAVVEVVVVSTVYSRRPLLLPSPDMFFDIVQERNYPPLVLRKRLVSINLEEFFNLRAQRLSHFDHRRMGAGNVDVV